MRHAKVKGFTRSKPSTDEKYKIIVPINSQNNHWLLAVIDNVKKTVTVYDSLPSVTRAKTVGDMMMKWVKAEHQHKKAPFEAKKWKITKDDSSPVQDNGYDCGVFTLVTAAHIAFKNTAMYSKKDLYENSRKRIAWSIFNQRVE